MTRLRELREAHNYTQDYVAEAIDVSRITYIRYETDLRPMKAPELIRLAALYHVSIDYLLGLSENPSPSEDHISTQSLAHAGPVRLNGQQMPQTLPELESLIQRIVNSTLTNRNNSADPSGNGSPV